MSRLVVRSRSLGQSFELNCLQFSSPIVASIGSSQTRTQMRHFPVKVNQAEIDFLVQFASEPDYERFQEFVRRTQQRALVNARYPGVTLSWPERGIRNWTGVIKSIRAGGMRFNPAPRATFSVSLIESSVSQRSFINTVASDWRTIFGLGTLAGELALPTPEQNARDIAAFGNTIQQAADAYLAPPAASDNITNGNLGIPPQGTLSQGTGE